MRTWYQRVLGKRDFMMMWLYVVIGSFVIVTGAAKAEKPRPTHEHQFLVTEWSQSSTFDGVTAFTDIKYATGTHGKLIATNIQCVICGKTPLQCQQSGEYGGADQHVVPIVLTPQPTKDWRTMPTKYKTPTQHVKLPPAKVF